MRSVVLQRLAIVREEVGHLRGALHVQLGVIDHLQTVRLIDGLAALDADHDVLGLGVIGVHVMDVVGHDERHAGAAAHLADAGVDGLLLGDPVRHELEVEIARPEDRGMLERDGARRIDAQLLDRA